MSNKSYNIWRQIRGPFYRIDCDSHQWEIFSCDQAACLLCGANHICCTSVAQNKTCELHQQRDGHFTCGITGLVVSKVCFSNDEFFQHCVLHKEQTESYQDKIDNIYNQVHYTVQNFLLDKRLTESKLKEHTKRVAKLQVVLSRLLKGFKISRPQSYPNIIQAFAQALHFVPLRYSMAATPSLILTATKDISKCLIDLKDYEFPNLEHVVIGMLYLMKSGLSVNNNVWLPKIQQLNFCLPHENSLGKVFGLSIKIICETENEIKLILRQKNEIL